jgi:uncharacterized DUF497 family protein
VTFEQVTEVFKDPIACTTYDEAESSKSEDRWITLGQAKGQHYLVVIIPITESYLGGFFAVTCFRQELLRKTFWDCY